MISVQKSLPLIFTLFICCKNTNCTNQEKGGPAVTYTVKLYFAHNVLTISQIRKSVDSFIAHLYEGTDSNDNSEV